MKAENLKYLEFWPKLHAYAARSDLAAMLQNAIQNMDEYQPAYDRARELLGPEVEDDLVMYVACCEEYYQAFALMAYEMGREEGPRKPNETFRDWVKDADYWEQILQIYDEDGNLKPN